MNTAAAPSLLLVDDDLTFCDVMARALSRRGFRVTLAHTVDEALEHARSELPAYAVIDLKMPGESGLRLIHELIAVPECRNCSAHRLCERCHCGGGDQARRNSLSGQAD